MPPPDFIKEQYLAATFELNRNALPLASAAERESMLLTAHFPHPHAWWRDFVALPSMELSPEEAAQVLRESLFKMLERSCPSWTLSVTLELQKISRAALRVGAWKLLSQTLQLQLQLLRAHLPTAKRLSIATGLVAEWALSSLRPEIASIYCAESLAWGNEPHRIRAYQAYAVACAQATGSYESLHATLSQLAIECQNGLHSRKPFAELHMLRVLSLERLFSEESEAFSETLQKSFDAFFKQHLPTLSRDTSLTAPPALALSASLVMEPYLNTTCTEETIEVITRFLNTSGRWKDMHLLHLAVPTRVPPLTPRQIDLIGYLDQCFPTEFLLHDFSPDSIYLQQLPTTRSNFDSTLAVKAHLCCI